MFRIIMGVALLVIGFFVMCGALAATHTGPPTDLLKLYTWLFWSLFVVPLALGIWLLFGKSLRKLFR